MLLASSIPKREPLNIPAVEGVEEEGIFLELFLTRAREAIVKRTSRVERAAGYNFYNFFIKIQFCYNVYTKLFLDFYNIIKKTFDKIMFNVNDIFTTPFNKEFFNNIDSDNS